MSARKSTPKTRTKAKARAKATRREATSPRQVKGSDLAKQRAAAILEVLCGVLGPTEGAAALGTQLSRYYVLEARALSAMVAALEPRARGRQRSHARELAVVTRERDRLAAEVARLSALVRATERVVGLAPPEKVGGGRRHKEPRGRRVVRALRPAKETSS
jgi:hypothetical protein